MKTHSILIVLFSIVYTSSVISGERISNMITKFNERRAAGILAQPRVGRTIGGTSLIRSDGPTGLVQYPRVGRSGHSSSYINLSQINPIKLNLDPREQSHNFNSDVSMDLDYQERLDSDEKTWKPIDILTKGVLWAGIKPRRETRTEQKHLRLYRSEGDIDENWIALPVQLQDFSDSEPQQQSSQDESKITREMNHA